jgi:hypothetical protein
MFMCLLRGRSRPHRFALVWFGPYMRRQVVAYLPGVLGVGLMIHAVMKDFTRK